MPGDDEPAPEMRETDPEALAKALELELTMKRAGWQKARERRSTWRALSILFLLLIILGALFAWLFLAPQLQERAQNKAPTAESPR